MITEAIKYFTKPFAASSQEDLNKRIDTLATPTIVATTAIMLSLVATVCMNPALLTSLSTPGLIAAGGILPLLPILMFATRHHPR
jgi:hypothetical protein